MRSQLRKLRSQALTIKDMDLDLDLVVVDMALVDLAMLDMAIKDMAPDMGGVRSHINIRVRTLPSLNVLLTPPPS